MSSPTWLRGWLRRRRAERPGASARIAGPGPALGGGELTGLGVSPKAAMLDRAAVAGLAVPAGFVLVDPNHAPPTPSESGLVRRTAMWAAAVGTRRLAVRSAFGAEDGDTASMAGWFTSKLDVAPDDIAGAVDEVRDSADAVAGHDLGPDDFRRDVLVMAMVDADHAGVAFSQPDTYDDLINATVGTADALVSGHEAGERRLLPRLEPTDPGWPDRLRSLLREVRRTFGDRAWDVEWADDGTTCWLVQIRPITAPPLRNELLTAANHAEILPPLPSTLMTSVVADAGPDLFAWYRRRVPGLPADRQFLHVKAGRPMINLSLLEDMLRHLGLPTGLVAGSIGGDTGSNRPARPGRMIVQAPALLRLGLSQISAVALAERNERRVAAIGAGPPVDLTATLDDLRRSYATLVTGMFPLSSAIGSPLALLRRAGTLYEHAARHRTITTELADRLAALESGATTDGVDRFLADFGHRGVYESDIARPRYADDPSSLPEPSPSRPDGGPGPVPPPIVGPPDRTWRGVMTLPIWVVASRPMAARERYRDQAMRSFAAIRSNLVSLAESHVAAGRLRSVDDLWLLTAAEARRLDRGWRPEPAFWVDREAERKRLADIDVPHVIGLHDDPAMRPADGGGDDAPGGRLTGLALTAGVIDGAAKVLAEPDDRIDRGGDRPLVVVARSIDAGWITTLQRADAVVVEIGGDLSHGSILVRELGLPAVTNVAGATRRIVDGDLLTVDGAAGTVEIRSGR